MAGDKGDICAEWPEPAGDRGDQRGVIAARKVGSADGAGEQHVADEAELLCSAEKHHMPRRVPRAVKDLERFEADLHLVALLQPAVWLKCLYLREAEIAGLGRQLLDPVAVAFVRTFDRQTELSGEFCSGTGVIDMGVSQQDLCQLYSVLLYAGKDFIQIATRIDDRPLHGFSTPDDRAVLLKSGNRNDENLKTHDRLARPFG